MRREQATHDGRDRWRRPRARAAQPEQQQQTVCWLGAGGPVVFLKNFPKKMNADQMIDAPCPHLATSVRRRAGHHVCRTIRRARPFAPPLSQPQQAHPPAGA